MTEKRVGIVIPTWNPNEPRFIVEDAHDELADNRAFKNGKCVYNQRLGVVYTVEYVVDALNELGDEIDKLKEENEELRRENKKKDIEIQSLNAHITNWLNETKIAKLYENEQYRTETLEKENEQLRQQLREMKSDEKLYAQEIVKLNKEAKEVLNFRNLGSDY